ncbi:MAG: hypothetical protein VB852_03300 [Deltaproteobacteria bacterium]
MTVSPKRPAAGRCLAALVLALSVVTFWPGQLRADQYSDESSHPLRLIRTVVHPVTKAVEWLVFKPLHLLGHLVVPDEGANRQRSLECRSVHRRPHRECRGV